MEVLHKDVMHKFVMNILGDNNTGGIPGLGGSGGFEPVLLGCREDVDYEK